MKTKTEILKWLRANLGDRCLGVLTSTDTHALIASVALTPLVSYSSAPDDLFEAYGAIVSQMQPQARYLAFHAIACELDWGHREMIWTQSGLTDQIPASRCKFEPSALYA